jgi:hypothetical protein
MRLRRRWPAPWGAESVAIRAGSVLPGGLFCAAFTNQQEIYR